MISSLYRSAPLTDPPASAEIHGAARQRRLYDFVQGQAHSGQAAHYELRSDERVLTIWVNRSQPESDGLSTTAIPLPGLRLAQSRQSSLRGTVSGSPKWILETAAVEKSIARRDQKALQPAAAGRWIVEMPGIEPGSEQTHSRGIYVCRSLLRSCRYP